MSTTICRQRKIYDYSKWDPTLTIHDNMDIMGVEGKYATNIWSGATLRGLKWVHVNSQTRRYVPDVQVKPKLASKYTLEFEDFSWDETAVLI